jgi:hypothetical protein
VEERDVRDVQDGHEWRQHAHAAAVQLGEGSRQISRLHAEIVSRRASVDTARHPFYERPLEAFSMNLKKMVIERGMKLMSDPRVMKLMSNPKVMNVVMKGFQLRGKAQASIDSRVASLAKSLKLATREEVRDLKDTIRTLERALKEVQAEVQKGNGAGAKATKPAS